MNRQQENRYELNKLFMKTENFLLSTSQPGAWLPQPMRH